MHKLFARQLAKATMVSGEVGGDLLSPLIDSAYEQTDRELDAHLRECAADLLRGQKMMLHATVASMAAMGISAILR